MSDMRSLIEKLTAISEDRPTVGDGVYLEFGNLLQVDTEIMEMSSDSITLLGDEKLISLLESLNQIEESGLKSSTLASYINKASDARKHRNLPINKVDNRYSGVHTADKILTKRSKEPVKENNTQLLRARDFGGNNNVMHYRDDYFIATNTHDDGDSRKVDHVLLKKMVKTDDEFTPAYQQIAVLKVSPYRATRDEINQAADRVIASSSNVSEGEVVSLHDNPQSLKRLAKMWWHGDEGKHAQAVKMLSNMGWDIAEDDDDIVLNKGGREIRFFMDDLYEEMVSEAEYHGRKVPLGKPMRGDVKKKKVYVKNPKTGKVIKVNFGDKKMRIKRSNPKRRKSFRARHNCKTAKDRTTARYWSCRAW